MIFLRALLTFLRAETWTKKFATIISYYVLKFRTIKNFNLSKNSRSLRHFWSLNALMLLLFGLIRAINGCVSRLFVVFSSFIFDGWNGNWVVAHQINRFFTYILIIRDMFDSFQILSIKKNYIFQSFFHVGQHKWFFSSAKLKDFIILGENFSCFS